MRPTTHGERFRWIRPGRGHQGGDRALGILPIDVQTTITGADATTMRVGPVRAQQYSLGSLPLYLDADVAWVHGSVWRPNASTGDCENQISHDMVATSAALRFGSARLLGGSATIVRSRQRSTSSSWPRLARSFYAVLDGDREVGAEWATRIVGALSTRFGSAH